MMKRLLAIFPIFLLVTMLAGCSSDDDEVDQEWPIKVLNNGEKVIIKEIDTYPDSLTLFNVDGVRLTVPCERIDKSELPSWVLPKAAEITNGVEMRTTISMGYENGKKLFIIHYSLEGGLGTLYDENGHERGQDFYHDLLSYSSNWKCVFIVKAYKL
jgi:hypothetical protein